MPYEYWTADQIQEKIRNATILGVRGLEANSEALSFETTAGTFTLYHEQDCCELVAIEDIVGDPRSLVGGKILLFEERVFDPTTEEGYEKSEGSYYSESATATWYEIQTTKGDVSIRWLGTSNGYYSESVSIAWTDAASQATA